MNGTWINGREATPDEAAVIAYGYACARARDLQLLAGVLGEGVKGAVPARAVTDITLTFS